MNAVGATIGRQGKRATLRIMCQKGSVLVSSGEIEIQNLSWMPLDPVDDAANFVPAAIREIHLETDQWGVMWIAPSRPATLREHLRAWWRGE